MSPRTGAWGVCSPLAQAQTPPGASTCPDEPRERERERDRDRDREIDREIDRERERTTSESSKQQNEEMEDGFGL